MNLQGRKRAFVRLGVTEAIILVGLIIEMAQAGCDIFEILIAPAVIGIITWMEYKRINKKYPLNEDERKKKRFDPALVEIPRTHEGTILEVLACLTLVVAWVVAIAAHRFTNDDGSIDWRIIMAFLLMTVTVIGILWGVYSPVNDYRVPRLKNIRQVALYIRECRIIAVELALGLLLCVCTKWPIEVLFALLIFPVATVIIFQIIIYRAKD